MLKSVSVVLTVISLNIDASIGNASCIWCLYTKPPNLINHCIMCYMDVTVHRPI